MNTNFSLESHQYDRANREEDYALVNRRLCEQLQDEIAALRRSADMQVLGACLESIRRAWGFWQEHFLHSIARVTFCIS